MNPYIMKKIVSRNSIISNEKSINKIDIENYEKQLSEEEKRRIQEDKEIR
jgi:hypothetical protein